MVGVSSPLSHGRLARYVIFLRALVDAFVDFDTSRLPRKTGKAPTPPYIRSHPWVHDL
jgi:hypothetical protein